MLRSKNLDSSEIRAEALITKKNGEGGFGRESYGREERREAKAATEEAISASDSRRSEGKRQRARS